MSVVICCVPCSPLRREPSHKSEMVSQLLFGELAEIIDQSVSNWVKIKCRYDGYEGWCQDSHTMSIAISEHDNDEKALTRGWITELTFNGEPMMVPLGSSLTYFSKHNSKGEKKKIHYKGKAWNPMQTKKNKKDIKRLAYDFLNTPYLWGGKTVFGADCSGYTQTVFRFFNIHLLRDAWQQATQGKLVNSLKQVKCGDLAFFDNAEGKIVHVGILLNKHTIIHASGKVRVDKIDEKGIIQKGSNERTHQLRLIKRYF